MGDKKRKLTYKEQHFVKKFTDYKDSTTFLNATQAANVAYDVNSLKSAAKIGSEKLSKVYIQEAIEKRISTKEQDQQTLTKYVERLDSVLSEEGATTPENAVFIREMRELIKLNGQFRGDFVEKTLNVNVETTLKAINDQFKNMYDTSSGGEGED